MNRLLIAFSSFVFLALSPVAALSGDVPAVCKEAMSVNNNPKKEIDLLTQCVGSGKLEPDAEAAVRLVRAGAYVQTNQLDKAIADYDRIVALRPNDFRSYSGRGELYIYADKFQQAVADLDKAVQLNPNYANAYSMRAYAHKALGKIDKARADSKKARSLDPKAKVPEL